MISISLPMQFKYQQANNHGIILENHMEYQNLHMMADYLHLTIPTIISNQLPIQTISVNKKICVIMYVNFKKITVHRNFFENLSDG